MASRTITTQELKERMEDGWDFILLDVRSRDAYVKEHIEGAGSMLLAEIAESHHELDGEKEIVVYCGSSTCQKSLKVGEKLRELGYNVIYYEAGIKAWREAGYPLES
ncbi:MAG: rhodanese-like domain-containing protein [Candidatus Hydrothermarchaeales archaeon]